MVVVDFFANWCPPCRYIAPILDEMNKEFGEIEIVKVDVDNADLKEIKKEHEITCMPTFIFFKGGKRIHQIEGADKESIRQFIEEHTGVERVSTGKKSSVRLEHEVARGLSPRVCFAGVLILFFAWFFF